MTHNEKKNQSQLNQKLHNDKILDKKTKCVKKRHGYFKDTQVELLKKKTAVKT